MDISSRIKGLGVALVTTFDSEGNVDLDSMKRVLEHVSKHADFLVPFGSTGESVTLDHDEKKEIHELVVNCNSKKLPIVYGLGGNNTRAILKEFDTLRWDGIDAILSVSPAYNKPSYSGLIKHFELLADTSLKPIILYNVPGRTASNMSAELTLELAQHPNIIGIKEASGNLNQITSIAAGKPKDFLLISGDDMLTLPMMALGAAGLISVLGNAYPAEFKQMIQSFINGSHQQATELLFRFEGLNPLMYEEGNPTGLKELLSQMGLCTNAVRLPLDHASSKLSEKIRRERF